MGMVYQYFIALLFYFQLSIIHLSQNYMNTEKVEKMDNLNIFIHSTISIGTLISIVFLISKDNLVLDFAFHSISDNNKVSYKQYLYLFFIQTFASNLALLLIEHLVLSGKAETRIHDLIEYPIYHLSIHKSLVYCLSVDLLLRIVWKRRGKDTNVYFGFIAGAILSFSLLTGYGNYISAWHSGHLISIFIWKKYYRNNLWLCAIPLISIVGLFLIKSIKNYIENKIKEKNNVKEQGKT